MGYLAISHLSDISKDVLFNKACQLKFWEWKYDPFLVAKPLSMGSLEKGETYSFEVEVFSLYFEAKYKIEVLEPTSKIQLKQVQGLFKNWTHCIHFESTADQKTLVSNIISYQLPLGLIGTLASDLFLKKKIEQAIDRKWSRITD